MSKLDLICGVTTNAPSNEIDDGDGSHVVVFMSNKEATTCYYMLPHSVKICLTNVMDNWWQRLTDIWIILSGYSIVT